jgi:hypothetical protein
MPFFCTVVPNKTEKLPADLRAYYYQAPIKALIAQKNYDDAIKLLAHDLNYLKIHSTPIDSQLINRLCKWQTAIYCIKGDYRTALTQAQNNITDFAPLLSRTELLHLGEEMCVCFETVSQLSSVAQLQESVLRCTDREYNLTKNQRFDAIIATLRSYIRAGNIERAKVILGMARQCGGNQPFYEVSIDRARSTLAACIAAKQFFGHSGQTLDTDSRPCG